MNGDSRRVPTRFPWIQHSWALLPLVILGRTVSVLGIPTGGREEGKEMTTTIVTTESNTSTTTQENMQVSLSLSLSLSLSQECSGRVVTRLHIYVLRVRPGMFPCHRDCNITCSRLSQNIIITFFYLRSKMKR